VRAEEWSEGGVKDGIALMATGEKSDKGDGFVGSERENKGRQRDLSRRWKERERGERVGE
jgi:hypothetical protein